MHRHFLPTCAFAGLTLLYAGPADAAGQADATLADFSLEQLSDIVVSSVSRQEGRLVDAPASIYVISGADIRRSGAATLPEALRLAPNLQVARADAHTYAISARGFSSTLANKLLVLIDGRSVYSPLFSGVFWDMQDVVMSDIERIEVISGPGATLWGANAVNGVINIITRAARDTQGGQLVARASDHGRSATVRYGGRLSNGAYYRVYGKAMHLSDTVNEDGGALGSGLDRTQTGFRLDWDGPAQALTLSGDAYAGRSDDMAAGATAIEGANLLGRATMRLENGSEVGLLAWFDHSRRDQPGVGAQDLDTLDLEAQQALRLGGRHSLVWGGGYRYSLDRVTNGAVLQFTPATRNLRWANLFAQDEIALTDSVRATAGVKLEHNVYTGLETLPSVRLAWSPDSTHLVWAAASRTVRAPSRIDRDLLVANPRPEPGAPRYLVDGGADFRSETAQVLELGYRAQSDAALSYSATLFYSDYDRLRTLEPRVGQGSVFENLGRGIARGVEAWVSWRPLRSWRLSGGGVVQRISTGVMAGSRDASGSAGLATNDPHSYFSLRSSHDLARNVQADVALRYVGSLPQPQVPAYHELDARVAWQAWPALELALAGRNLLHRAHVEFGQPGMRQLIERNLMLTASLRF
ncbi:MAG: TonB-dependent receptor plug domain-containing protein [Massilia sp.]